TRVGGVPEVLGQEYPGFIADTSAKGLRSLARSFLENHDLLQDYVRRRAKYLESEWGDDKLADMIIAFIKRLLEIK
ncbi:MAG: hypothetical protein LRS43_04495, partial [Desulfurococcales archaeon]|nr:hypothetical protein [Desulfurococcales archaeon]